jgi:hypothetical protein
MGSGGIAPPFLTSELDGNEWSASCPGYFTPRWLGEPQSLSGLCGEEKNLALPGIEPGPSNP